MGPKPQGEFKLNWQPSELPGEEFADIRGRGRFTIRTTDQATWCSDTTARSCAMMSRRLTVAIEFGI